MKSWVHEGLEGSRCQDKGVKREKNGEKKEGETVEREGGILT